MSVVKVIAVVLVLCCAADAFRIDAIPEAIMKQISQALLHRSNQPNKQQPNPVYPNDKETRQEKEKPHQPWLLNLLQPKDKKPLREIIDERDRIFLLPSRNNKNSESPLKKIGDQVVIFEKEIIRTIIGDNKEQPLKEEPSLFIEDQVEPEDHGHFGKSLFADAAEGHFGHDDDEEFCGGNEPEEPESLLRKVNDFDAIAEAILERRLAKLANKPQPQRDEPRDVPRDVPVPKPSRLTTDEAKVWNQKLSDAIKTRRANTVDKAVNAATNALNELNF